MGPVFYLVQCDGVRDPISAVLLGNWPHGFALACAGPIYGPTRVLSWRIRPGTCLSKVVLLISDHRSGLIRPRSCLHIVWGMGLWGFAVPIFDFCLL